MRVFGFKILVVTCCLLALPIQSRASGSGEGNEMSSGSGGVAGLSSATTKNIVKILTRDFGRCGRIRPVYRYDCYRQTYRLAANEIIGRPAYSEAYQALALVEDRLDQIVKENRDPAAKPIRRGFQVYKPIKPAAVPKAKAQTEKALSQAETILLRSPPSKQKHYARIAEAVNSNKVLLRSALLPGGLIRFAWSLMNLALHQRI